MNKVWQEFLTTQGATFTDGQLVSFSENEISAFDAEKTYLSDLSNLGLIQASGEDAQSFLQGQFTNDLNLVTPNNSQLSSYCNPKGRILSVFRIFKRNEDYFLILHREVIETTLKKLNMFKLMAKVELTDVSDEYVLFGAAGPNTDSTFSEHNITLPKEDHQVSSNDETSVIKISNNYSRYLFISLVDNAINIWNSVSENVTFANSVTWEVFDIQEGIPQITSETSEAFIPQMINLELIDGVNFQKGCYPGQEIVARTHYLGKPNRRMYRIDINSDTLPLAGENIYAESDGDQPVGKIVNAHKINENNYSALAVLRTAKENADDLHLGNKDESKITHEPLPYSLDQKL